MKSYLTEFIRRKCVAIMGARQPDLFIENNGISYLARWYVIPRNPFFNVYVHHFIGNDQDDPHDHPWVSLSLCLQGALQEDIYKVVRRFGKKMVTNIDRRRRTLTPGQWKFRSPWFVHKLSLPDGDHEAITLFITGPKVRTWGFWVWNKQPGLGVARFVKWQQYISSKNGEAQ